jgi:surface protein
MGQTNTTLPDNIENTNTDNNTKTQITDGNIEYLLYAYFLDKSDLPFDLQKKPLNKWDLKWVDQHKHKFLKKSWNNTKINALRQMKNKTTIIITNANIQLLIDAYLIYKKILPTDLQDKPLNDWDVSRVSNMKSLFAGRHEFNEPLDKWDVSNVVNMEDMFQECVKFNQLINTWDVRNVKSMEDTFNLCNDFNQPLNNWDVGDVVNMRRMFYGCNSFNQSLNNWNVSKVKNMSEMFHKCSVFNQPFTDFIFWPENRKHAIT